MDGLTQGLGAQVALLGSLRVSPDRTGVENVESTAAAAPASAGSLEVGCEPEHDPNSRPNPKLWVLVQECKWRLICRMSAYLTVMNQANKWDK